MVNEKCNVDSMHFWAVILRKTDGFLRLKGGMFLSELKNFPYSNFSNMHLKIIKINFSKKCKKVVINIKSLENKKKMYKFFFKFS